MAEELGRAISIRLPSWISMETATTVLGTVGGTVVTSYGLQQTANYLNATGWKKVGLAYLVGGVVSLLGYIGVQRTTGWLRYLSFGGIIGGLVTPISLTIMQAIKTIKKEEQGTTGTVTRLLAGIAGEPISSVSARPVYVAPSQPVRQEVVVVKPPREVVPEEEKKPVLTATIE